MTKKEFIQMCDYHRYTSRGNPENNVGAVFFDRNEDGFKYCVYGRICLTGKQALIDALWKVVRGTADEDTIPYYVQLAVAETEEQRFKVPLQASGLGRLLTQRLR